MLYFARYFEAPRKRNKGKKIKKWPNWAGPFGNALRRRLVMGVEGAK
jgi:hypothetical protein